MSELAAWLKDTEAMWSAQLTAFRDHLLACNPEEGG
jgi:hypothetical protein